VNILDGNAEDLIAECTSYEQRIKDFGGIELFLGGIGDDGHIAFNVTVLIFHIAHISAHPG
jgi:glucosamine-6-phosphate deaminase